MATTSVLGLTIAYDLVGDASSRTWVITPGGRFAKDDPGLAEMAADLAADGGRVLLWDRPNCGASDVSCRAWLRKSSADNMLWAPAEVAAAPFAWDEATASTWAPSLRAR